MLLNKIGKDDYFKAEDQMSSKSSLDDAFTKELLLEKDPKLFLRAVITDAKSNALLEGVTLKVTDISTPVRYARPLAAAAAAARA